MLANSEKVVQRWKIPHDLSGIRADHYLVHHIGVGRISRQKAQKIIQSGDFRLSKTCIKASKRLQTGDFVELWRLPPDSVVLNKPVGVIYEDADLLVLNKPSDLATHPSARYLYQTVTHWLKLNYPNLPIHPCHRLDRETSGVLVCAKNARTESHVKQAFMRAEVQKTYHAWVEGRMAQSITCTRRLALQGSRGLVGIKMIEDPEGLPSETVFEPLSYDPVQNWTLVACKPKTGRQHQIRAHLSLEGYPVIGDKLYGMGEIFFDAYTQNKADLSLLALPRQALHAYQVELKLGEKNYVFMSPMPRMEPPLSA